MRAHVFAYGTNLIQRNLLLGGKAFFSPMAGANGACDKRSTAP
jgi:hypothetical protein